MPGFKIASLSRRLRRSGLPTTLLILLALAGSFPLPHTIAILGYRVPDGVVSYEYRFAALIPQIKHLRSIGYISDWVGDDDTRGYFMAQYTLAPVQLIPLRGYWEARGAQTPCLIVGDFHTLPVDTAELQKAGYEIVTDLGNGVMLLRSLKERQK